MLMHVAHPISNPPGVSRPMSVIWSLLYALRHQLADEHLEAVGVRRVAGLSEVGAQHEVLPPTSLTAWAVS